MHDLACHARCEFDDDDGGQRVDRRNPSPIGGQSNPVQCGEISFVAGVDATRRGHGTTIRQGRLPHTPVLGCIDDARAVGHPTKTSTTHAATERRRGVEWPLTFGVVGQFDEPQCANPVVGRAEGNPATGRVEPGLGQIALGQTSRNARTRHTVEGNARGYGPRPPAELR